MSLFFLFPFPFSLYPLPFSHVSRKVSVMKFISLLCDLEEKKVVLATQSPRRIELLRSVGLDFEIYPPRIEEKQLAGYTPVEYVRHNAIE
ncbi:MAG: hypothetical protein EH225_07130, partial [Calditrichaeota bacterium]